jgi:alkyl hydroperoxide reductase subunit D
MTLNELLDTVPTYAKDLKLNLSTLLQQQELNEQQIWGTVAVAAIASLNPRLLQTLLAEAASHLSPQALEAAKSAAAIMGMNNVYYRFQHLAKNPKYATLPARLRMNVLRNHGVDPIDFELWCTAVSAINGCGLLRRFSRAGAPQQRHDGRVDPSGGAVGVCDSWSGSGFRHRSGCAQSTRAQPNLKFLHPKLAATSRAAAIPIRIGARRFRALRSDSHGRSNPGYRWRGLHRLEFHSPMDCLGECAGRQSRQVDLRRQSQEPASRRKRSALSL